MCRRRLELARLAGALITWLSRGRFASHRDDQIVASKVRSSEILKIVRRDRRQSLGSAEASLAIRMVRKNIMQQCVTRLPIGISHLETQMGQLTATRTLNIGRFKTRLREREVQEIKCRLPLFA